MLSYHCRACGKDQGAVVLDLGLQPACDAFPSADSTGPDPRYPLRMWLCESCKLAQLMEDPTTPEEPQGIEPAALVAQAHQAIASTKAAGFLSSGSKVIEFSSPHGGSWLPMLSDLGITTANATELADIVLDCFGMMHHADQAKALQERVDRLTEAGTLLIQYHSLAAIIQHKQWNSLRHGHFGYYSARALTNMLAAAGLVPRTAWRFDLYGGTVLLAAGRDGVPDSAFREIVEWEDSCGAADPQVVQGLQESTACGAEMLQAWLKDHSDQPVYGYGAASRTVTLLCHAGIDADLLPAIADAAPAKWGKRIPGTEIPIISPEQLVKADPASILLFLPDLLSEVQTALPSLIGRWVSVEQIPLTRLESS